MEPHLTGSIASGVVCLPGDSPSRSGEASGFVDRVLSDLTGMTGVSDVNVGEDGADYTVNVKMSSLDFGEFEKVIPKEMELAEELPKISFNFHVTFVGGAR